jgi:hypothetical protein
MKTKLQKVVMRRVYYSYTLSFLSESMLWQGFVLGACIALFGRLTFVAAIMHNIAAMRVGNVPHYILGSFEKALTHGEFLTVLVTLGMIGLSVSFMYRALGILSRTYQPQMA